MARIHPNWIIREHVADDDHVEVVETAKAGKKKAKPATEKAVKPPVETRDA